MMLTAVIFVLFLLLRAGDGIARHVLRRPVRALAPRAVSVWARVALLLLGVRFRCVGSPMSRPGAVVANHASWIDIVALMRAAPVFFVSKSEVSGWPVIGWIGRAIGTIFIDRRPSEARRQNDALRSRFARGETLCLFPEGTSTDGRRVLAFKSTLFGVFTEPGLRETLWVQPASVRYQPRPGLPVSFYGWWGEMEFGAHLVRVLALSTGGSVDVTFHEPLRAADYPDRKTLAAAAERLTRQGFERETAISSDTG